MSEYQIKDDGDLRKYYAQIPHLVDDMGLTVYEYRLYGHLKRVTGDNGKCWQSSRTLAKACNISLGMTTKAKEGLKNKGLIKIDSIKDDKGEHHEITIVDIWPENMNKYGAKVEIEIVYPDGCSPHEQVRSQDEQTCSPHETKNNPIKNNPIKNEEEGEHPNIYTLYENNIGTITKVMRDVLIDAEETYPEAWIEEAIEIAVKNNARRWNYIEAILKRWETQGKDNGYKPRGEPEEEDALTKYEREKGIKT